MPPVEPVPFPAAPPAVVPAPLDARHPLPPSPSLRPLARHQLPGWRALLLHAGCLPAGWPAPPASVAARLACAVARLLAHAPPRHAAVLPLALSGGRLH